MSPPHTTDPADALASTTTTITTTSNTTSVEPLAQKQKQPLRDRVLPNAHVRSLVEQGQIIVIQGRNVLKLDRWADRHPGGRRIILHVVGREASTEMRSFHSPQAREMMARFCIGVLEERWQNMVPPLHRDAYHGPEIPQPLLPVLVEEEKGEEEEEVAEEVMDETKPTTLKNIDDHDDTRCTTTALDHTLLSAPAIQRHDSSTSTSSSPTSYSPSSSSSIPASSRPPSVFSANHTDPPSAHSADPLPCAQMDAQTQDELLARFVELQDRIEAEGLYAASAACYAVDFARVASLFALMLFFLHHGWYLASACFMGFFWHQIVATAHDAGHLAVTQLWTLDTVIGTVVMNFAGGLSCGWWKRNHNVHHLVPNSLSHDADIQLLPFISLSPRMFDGMYSTVADAVIEYSPLAAFFVARQAWLYYILLSLGRFNLYFLAFEYVLGDLFGRRAATLTPMHRRHRILEALGLLFFWAWYGYLLVYRSIPGIGTRLAFILISHVVTLPLHLQLTVSHFSMSTDEGPASESWIERTVRTTMDIDASRWLDWFHGGLQFQVTHHLFPRLPRHSLRRASELTREFCRDAGLPYERYDFPECNLRLIRHLAEVAALARLLVDCKDEVVRKGEYLHGHWE